jgi:hypothetical protein
MPRQQRFIHISHKGGLGKLKVRLMILIFKISIFERITTRPASAMMSFEIKYQSLNDTCHWLGVKSLRRLIYSK